jgi:predicted negative regulator of RcsB-dependent stress response
MTILRVVDYYTGQFRYFWQLLLAIVLVGVMGASFLGYRWYHQWYTEQAHAELARAIEVFERAHQEGTEALWDEADRAFGNGYIRYQNSSLAPYFLAFQAEVALRAGNKDKARDLMAKVLHSVKKDSPFSTAYAIKQARMNIDSGQPELVEQGMQALRLLAQDAGNVDRDMALYYQGLIPFEQGDRKAALEIWEELIKAYGQESLWAQVAQAKLDYTM